MTAGRVQCIRCCRTCRLPVQSFSRRAAPQTSQSGQGRSNLKSSNVYTIAPTPINLIRRHYSTQNETKPSKKACTKCSTPLPLVELSCPSCGALQALPSDLDAYDLLDLDIRAIGANGWQIDLGELKSQWRRRVALSHPDRMGGKDDVSIREGDKAVIADQGVYVIEGATDSSATICADQ